MGPQPSGVFDMNNNHRSVQPTNMFCNGTMFLGM